MICGYILNINWGDAPTWSAAGAAIVAAYFAVRIGRKTNESKSTSFIGNKS